MTSLPATKSIAALPAAHEETVSPRVPELAKALASAQQKCRAAAKDGYNAHHRYKYTTAEAIIEEAKAALADSGLSVFCSSPKLKTTAGSNYVFHVMTRDVTLLHGSGEFVPLGEVIWPVVEEKGRPIDKAFAIAITSSLAYVLRDLLLMPRINQEDDLPAREDRPVEQSSPTAPARPAQPAPAQPTAAATPSSAGTGEAEVGQRITEEQQTELSALIRDTGTDVNKLMGHYKIRGLGKLPAVKFAEIRDELVKRKNARPVAAPAAPTNGAPKPTAPTLTMTQAEQLGGLFTVQKLPLQDWLKSLDATQLVDVPARYLPWLRLIVAQGIDLLDLVRTLKVEKLSHLPPDRLVAMTVHELRARIDMLMSELRIGPAEWNSRLKDLFGTTDTTSLKVEQLEQLEKRLTDYQAKKTGATVPAGAA